MLSVKYASFIPKSAPTLLPVVGSGLKSGVTFDCDIAGFTIEALSSMHMDCRYSLLAKYGSISVPVLYIVGLLLTDVDAATHENRHQLHAG